MTGQDAYNELYLKIKNLSNNVYQSTAEIKKDKTILIVICTIPSEQLKDDKISNLNLIDSVNVKIKVTQNNKAFKELN